MRRRESTLAAIDSIWHRAMYPEAAGLSQPFAAAVRRPDSVSDARRRGTDRLRPPGPPAGRRYEYPDSPDHAMDAITRSRTRSSGRSPVPAVDDNTTPAEKRSGIATANQQLPRARARRRNFSFAHISPGIRDRLRAILFARGRRHVRRRSDAGLRARISKFRYRCSASSIERQISISLSTASR